MEAAPAGAWSRLAYAGGARCGHTATVVGAHVYVCGGRRGDTYFTDLLRYDAEAGTWETLSQTISCGARANHSATLVHPPGGGAEIWFVAGQSKELVYDDCWALDLATLTWRRVEVSDGGQGLLSRTAHTAEPHPQRPHEILIFGGYGGNGQSYAFVNSLVSLDTVTGAAVELAPAGRLPTARAYHSWSTVGSVGYVFGGRCGEGGIEAGDPSLLCAYDAAANAWLDLEGRVHGEAPGPRSSHRSVALAGRVLMLGGTAKGPTGKPAGTGSLRTLIVAPAGQLVWSSCDEPPGTAQQRLFDRSAHAMMLLNGGGALAVHCGFIPVDRERGRKTLYTGDFWALPLDADAPARCAATQQLLAAAARPKRRAAAAGAAAGRGAQQAAKRTRGGGDGRGDESGAAGDQAHGAVAAATANGLERVSGELGTIRGELDAAQRNTQAQAARIAELEAQLAAAAGEAARGGDGGGGAARASAEAEAEAAQLREALQREQARANAAEEAARSLEQQRSEFEARLAEAERRALAAERQAKQAKRGAEEAEQSTRDHAAALADALQRAADAEQRAADAERRADEAGRGAEAQAAGALADALQRAADAEQRAADAERRADEAGRGAEAQAAALLAEALQRADEAERRASAAEQQAADAERRADEAGRGAEAQAAALLAEALQRADEAERRASAAEQSAAEAQQLASEAQEAAAEARGRASEADRLAAEVAGAVGRAADAEQRAEELSGELQRAEEEKRAADARAEAAARAQAEAEQSMASDVARLREELAAAQDVAAQAAARADSLAEELAVAQAAAERERSAWEHERQQLRLDMQTLQEATAGHAQELLKAGLGSSRAALEAQWRVLGMLMLHQVDLTHEAIRSGGSIESTAALEAAAAGVLGAAAGAAPGGGPG
ncbi:hypothetical protein Rsub_01709 [Raphidocelis subcapitata]|uniref:Attractin/MKLN-like beta-propeller domain-containing protein n=1 Tax=Raphidocelis subcapitata TaxID=307507 RepID=A0A2V0NMQ3_9CHLO|nr:hypothetical protein Rsub_01709 [Raphidocelis subcapitata]|eukprot:GBF88808.1 hypothetical protein Rsub_01709 [Raphidocelis subcapitata]